MQHRRALLILKFLALAPSRAAAHASEQGFVLLLPTELYTGAGVVAVGLTLVVLALVPGRLAVGLFRTVALPKMQIARLAIVTSCLSAGLLAPLIAAGLTGPRDPLANPLPLMVWTVFWIGVISLQGVGLNLWRFVNPLSGPLALAGPNGALRLPVWLGCWPALLSFLVFAYVLLVNPAPADPARLARLAGLYWASSFCAALIFGRRWLVQGEVFTVMMRTYGRVSAVRGAQLGLPGWSVARTTSALGPAVLAVFLLGTGSFDGLNETFWWLSVFDINPFEYPGRSGVIWQNTIGLLAANLGLLCLFLAILSAGDRLTSARTRPAQLLRSYAPTLLPIALGYHVAHYLPSFMVDSQYAMVALSDPLMTGADLLGLGEFYVTTGFFNTEASVRRIYLTQAGAIVLGHVIAVLAAHAIALRHHDRHRDAVLSQAPLAAFMVAYTWFGLWLLASPRF